MISWIQITFQRHFRILFFGLLIVLIISFVFTIGAPGIGSGDRQVQARTFFDLNLNSPEDQAKLYGDANLSVFLQVGQQNISPEQIQDYALQRYASLSLAKQWNLPGPNETEKMDFIKKLPAFAGTDGEFDVTAYSAFRDNLKISGQFTEADVNRVVVDDFRAQSVRDLLGGPGYVDDSEIAFQLARTETKWSADIAKVNYTTFAPQITPTDDQLQSYFESNTFRYETPPKVRVDYIDFPASRYLAQITLTEDQIRSFYDSNPARFPAPEKDGTTAPVVGDEDPLDADYLAVRDQVSAAMRLDLGRRIAAEAASDLTVALFDAKLSSDTYEAFVASQGLTLRSAPAFSNQAPPGFLGGSPVLARQAFALTAEKPLSDALTTPTGAVVLIWRESIPSAPSQFAAVADRVRADYIDNEKRKQFVELGRNLRTQITAKVASGTSFAEAVKAATNTSGAEIETVSFTDFTRREPPADFPGAAANSLEQLEAGDVSEMVISGNEGLITFAAAKVAPVADATNPRFAELKEQIAEYNSATTASATLQALIEAELGLSSE
jgi:peptidyl-prolyl cis-trans isomerase D